MVKFIAASVLKKEDVSGQDMKYKEQTRSRNAFSLQLNKDHCAEGRRDRWKNKEEEHNHRKTGGIFFFFLQSLMFLWLLYSSAFCTVSPPLLFPLLHCSLLLLLHLFFRPLFRQTCLLILGSHASHPSLPNPPGVLLTDTQSSCFIAYDKTLPLISHYRPTLWKWALSPSAQYCP